MAVAKVVIVHSPAVSVEVELHPTIYCNSTDVFFIGQNENAKQMLITVESLRVELARSRKRYDNLLKGLNYFKQRATDGKN